MDQLLLKNLLLLAILLTVGIVFSFVAIKLIIQIFKRGLDIGEALKNPAIVILFSASILCMGSYFQAYMTHYTKYIGYWNKPMMWSGSL